MAKTSRVGVPLDQNNNVVQITPPVTAVAQTYDATISTSTEITLNSATTFIEVTAIDEGIFMKWGTADVTNANYDEYIAKDTTRQYYVPYESDRTLHSAVNFLQKAATAELVVIEK